ncbi:MAG: CHAD domain-containing protein [Gammaproteobacteria bacterium]
MRTDYLIPDHLDSSTVEEELCKQLPFSAEPARQEQRTYYDSFDWRLYGNHTVLEDCLDGRQHILLLRALNSGKPLARERLTRHPAFIQDLPPGRLHDELAPVLEMRELLPLAIVRVRVRNLRLLNKDDKTVARVQIEESSLQTRKGARARHLASRVILLPVKGYHKPAAQITEQLEALQLEADTQDPMVSALSEAGITPGDYSSKLNLHLEPDMRADQATRIILHRLLDVIQANEAGTRTGTDTEFLHDFRVAVRRTRSALGQIKGVLPLPVLNRYKREFAWLGQLTGNTRDLDVYLLTFDDYRNSLPDSMQADIEPLREFLQRHWQIEHKALVKALDSARYRRLFSSWCNFLETPVKQRSTLPNARRPVYEIACKRIWRVYRLILKEGRAIEADTPAEALHELRKTAKKLRYLMEFFQSLFPAGRIKRLIGVLKALQDNLGDFQDFEVQVLTLKRFSEQMVEEAGVPARTLLAMGMLIEGLERRQHQARVEFSERFTAFSLPENQARFQALFASPALPEAS